MKKIVMNLDNFFKGYSNQEVEEINIILGNMQKYINKGRIDAAAKVLNNPISLKYPELCFFLVNLLIELGQYRLANKIVKKMDLTRISKREDYKEFVMFKDEFFEMYSKLTKEEIAASAQVRREFVKEENKPKVEEVKVEDVKEAVPVVEVKEKVKPTKTEEEIKKAEEEKNARRAARAEIVSTLLTRLFANVVTKEEIESAEITDLQKNILLTAYMEKISKQSAAAFIKNVKKNDPNRINDPIYNKVLTNVLNKRKLFAIDFYSSVLSVTINYDLYQEIISARYEEARKEKEEVKNHVVVLKPTIKETSYKYEEDREKHRKISSAKKVVKKIKHPVETVVVPKVVKEQIIRDITIKEAFSEECDVIMRYLYCKMQDLSVQRDAVKAFDNFEIIIEKKVTDINALERFKKVVVAFSDRVNTMKIEYREEKFKKYMRK